MIYWYDFSNIEFCSMEILMKVVPSYILKANLLSTFFFHGSRKSLFCLKWFPSHLVFGLLFQKTHLVIVTCKFHSSLYSATCIALLLHFGAGFQFWEVPLNCHLSGFPLGSESWWWNLAVIELRFTGRHGIPQWSQGTYKGWWWPETIIFGNWITKRYDRHREGSPEDWDETRYKHCT